MVASRLFPAVWCRWCGVVVATLLLCGFFMMGVAYGEPSPTPPTTSSSLKASPLVERLLEKVAQAQANNNKIHDGEEYSVENHECVAGKLAGIKQDILSGAITDQKDLDFQLDEALTVCSNKAFGKHPISGARHGVRVAASNAWNDAIGRLARATLSAVSEAFQWLINVWSNGVIEASAIGPITRGVRNLTAQLQIAVMVIALMISGAKLAFDRKRAVVEGAEETAAALARAAGAAFFLPTAVVALHNLGDAVSRQVIDHSSGGDVAAAVQSFQSLADGGTGPVVVLVASIVALLGLFTQVIALIVRDVVLIVVVGLAPFAAAASATAGGKRSWEQVTAFTLAALLFKPIGSILYAVVFWTQSYQPAGFRENEASVQLVGLILLALSGFIMPGLVRIMVPAAAALGSSSALSSTMIASAGAMVGAGAHVGAQAGRVAGGAAGWGMAKAGASLASSGGVAGREMRQLSRTLAAGGGGSQMSAERREAVQARMSQLSSRAEKTRQVGGWVEKQGANLQAGADRSRRGHSMSAAVRSGTYLGGAVGGLPAAVAGSAIGHYPGRIAR